MNSYLKDGRHAHEKNDCSVIAFSYACDLDYADAHNICKGKGREDKKGFCLKNVFCTEKGYFLKEKEFKQYVFSEKKFVITFYGRPKMSVGKFRKTNPTGTFIVRVGGHLFCMKDGVIFNQSNENDKISYYHKVIKVN